jgi:hypothetical protein
MVFESIEHMTAILDAVRQLGLAHQLAVSSDDFFAGSIPACLQAVVLCELLQRLLCLAMLDIAFHAGSPLLRFSFGGWGWGHYGDKTAEMPLFSAVLLSPQVLAISDTPQRTLV